MSDDLAIETHGLTKRFGERTALDGIDLQVPRGCAFGFLGPNGAGKTTTLLMLLGVVTPDAGSVDLVGHRLPQGRRRAMACVGFAAGYLPLAERMRVREFLRMYADLYGVVRPKQAIDEALAHLEAAFALRPENRIYARRDEDFQGLADDPRFRRLVNPAGT